MKESYKNLLINSIKNKDSKIYANSNRDAYHIFLNSIFLYAEHEINILITNFLSIDKILKNEDFEIIKNFLETKKLNIFYFKNFETSLFSKLIDLTSPNIFIKKINSPIFNKDQMIQEFITWDNHGYRFSPNAKKLIGIVSANDIDFTKICNQLIFSKNN